MGGARRARALALAVALGAGVAACTTTPPADVPALRYRQWVSGGALEAAHGLGHWIEEFWLPDAGVWFVVDSEPLEDVLVGFAGFATLQERTRPNYGAPPDDTKPTELLVPVRIAEQAVALARLDRELEERRRRLGPEWTNSLAIKSRAELNPDQE